MASLTIPLPYVPGTALQHFNVHEASDLAQPTQPYSSNPSIVKEGHNGMDEDHKPLRGIVRPSETTH